MASTTLASNRGTLDERAAMLAHVRRFFSQRGVMEVDTPLLSPYAPIDAHIDVMRVEMGGGRRGYLHTSPEYAMKKLLAEGAGDIYQLSHVYRADQEGPLHACEFTMVEWYRLGMNLEELIEETLQLIQLFLGAKKWESLTYKEAFQRYADLDPHCDDLTSYVSTYAKKAVTWDRDTQLQLLFSHLIAPQMESDALTVITQFPASQAILAKAMELEGVCVACRFEVYFGDVELANGFDELSDPEELQCRLERENGKRIALGKDPLPLDRELITCLHSFPECVGVAVGFDRLMRWLAPCR